MLKTLILPAAIGAALMSAAVVAQAASAPTGHPPQPVFTTAERAQLAAEAGVTMKQADQMTLTQLAELKSKRDGDDGAYSLAPAMRAGARS